MWRPAEDASGTIVGQSQSPGSGWGCMLDAGGVLKMLGNAPEGIGSGSGPARARGSDTASRPGRPRGWPQKRRGGD